MGRKHIFFLKRRNIYNIKNTAEVNQNTESNYMMKETKSIKRFSRMIKTKRKLSRQKAENDEVENSKKKYQRKSCKTFELPKYWSNLV